MTRGKSRWLAFPSVRPCSCVGNGCRYRGGCVFHFIGSQMARFFLFVVYVHDGGQMAASLSLETTPWRRAGSLLSFLFWDGIYFPFQPNYCVVEASFGYDNSRRNSQHMSFPAFAAQNPNNPMSCFLTKSPREFISCQARSIGKTARVGVKIYSTLNVKAV